MEKSFNIQISNDLAQAIDSIQKYDYALLYSVSQTILCRCSNIKNINAEQLIEARFFNSNEELHIVNKEESTQIYNVSDRSSGEAIIKEYALSRKYSSLGHTLLVKEYIRRDADGQAVIELTRLAGIK